MRSRARALSLACWLAIIVILVRIAVARGTFTNLGNPPPIVAVAGIPTGLALLAAAVFLAGGFAAGTSWAPRASRIAAVLTIPFGLYLFLAGHQSGSLIALAAVACLVASILDRPRPRRPA